MTILPKIMNVRHNLPIYVALSIVLLVLCVSGLFFFSGHFARNPEIEVQADNNYEDTLHVVTDKDYKPYSFYDEEGNRSGYDVELITLIANRLHMNLDLDFVTWDEGLAIATGGGADVLMTCGLSDNFEGVENLIKTEITSMDEFAVYSKKPVSKLSSLHGKRIAIMANGNVVPEMEMLGLLPYCHFYTDNKSAMQALLDDEADFAVMRQAVGTMLLESMDLPGVSAYISAGRSYMCYCVNKNKPELADKINACIEELILNGEYDKLCNKWLTTFVRPYTFKEVLEQNLWILIVYFALVAIVVFGVLRDNKRKIDALRKEREMQARLESALSMAQSANKAKTTFLNNMSHDMRTPMNAIIGYSGLAAKHIDDKPQVQDYLAKIGKSSNHLLSLINDVLDMSRIESGKMSLEEKPENLTDIINTLSDIVQADMDSKQHNFSIDIVNLDDECVVCDRLRLNQVLLNILSNSIKYTAPGGTISMQVMEKSVSPSESATYEFRIKDNGMGMDEEFRKVLFEPFTRVKSSTVSGIQGTGLGMAITKSIIDMMGGRIEVKSELGKGTEITITFDFRLAGPEEDARPDAEQDCTGCAVEDFSLAGLKILLVEDNEINREIATAVLGEFGCVVSSAEDGDVAVRMMAEAKEGDYDIVLMDVQMPTIDGYEATRQIRALGTEISRVPILAMTANAFEEDRRTAIEAGMNEHIAKPIDVDNFRAVISRFVPGRAR